MEQPQIQETVMSFFRNHRKRQFRKKDSILQPEDSILSVYYLLEGFVRMYSIFSDGKVLTFNIFKPGLYFPLFLAFTSQKNAYFYQSLTPVSVLEAPKEDVIRFVRNNPDVLFDFTKRVSRGVHGLLTNLQFQLFGTVHRRITSTIVLLLKRFGENEKDGIRITIPLTHQDIANLTGVARETASLEMEELQKKDIISYAHKIIRIHNLRKLIEESSLDTELLDMSSDT